ncbi:hypothetical protein Nepgr_009194 [Nepenthes gracilis]|uniref:Uncharacterized protein n=1 Tax=Nepenthes gracilis TaxID=150966 RepID=A0AAD3SAP1_NEPGR|nr:hypothetical protein Nepgr_009194 [Nepenthes gracilis]
MVNIEVQVSTPIRDAILCGNCPPVGNRKDNHLDPCVRALAMKMDNISKAVQIICTQLDERPKGFCSPTSQTATSKRRNRGRKHSSKKICQQEDLGIQVASMKRGWQLLFEWRKKLKGFGSVSLEKTLEEELLICGDLHYTHSLPYKFKMPTVDPYDGSYDPMDHLDNFYTL